MHGARQESLRGHQHTDLRLGLQRGIQRLDVGPQVAQLPRVAHHGEGARDRGGRGAGALADVAHERGAAAIDQRVHDLKGRDLAAQAMGADRRLELLLQRRREIAHQLGLEQRIVRQIGVQDLVVEIDLGVGQQHAELGPRQILLALSARPHRRRVGQEFDGAIESSLTLERAHEAFEPVVLLARLRLGHADRQALLVIVAQHQCRHLVGHAEQQRVAVGGLERAGRDRLAGHDLDVDLVVGRIDAGGIV